MNFTFSNKPKPPIPGTDVVPTPLGAFLFGVAIAAGVVVTVRFGPKIVSRIFAATVGRLVFFWGIRKFISNTVTGPLPGLPEPNRGPESFTIIIAANIFLYAAGIWDAVMHGTVELAKEIGQAIVDDVNAGLVNLGEATVALGLGAHVIDDGGPVVIVTSSSGNATVIIGSAWRADP